MLSPVGIEARKLPRAFDFAMSRAMDCIREELVDEFEPRLSENTES